MSRGVSVNVLVQSAMITVMLLHSIWGCCWHHDHDHSSCQSAVGHATGHASHSHDCGHSDAGHSHDSEDPCDSPDHPHVPCDHDECVYLLVKAAGVPSSLDVATIACFDRVWPVRSFAEVHRCVETAVTSSRSFTALDSCALLQVWRV